MSIQPINHAIRFLLELAAIFTFGYWGFHQTESGARILLAIGLPLLFALLWGVFAVRNDPSRSGKTVVQTPGLIRLILELGLFTAATWMLLDLEWTITAYIFAGIVIIHYVLSYKRIRWMLKQN